MNVYYNSEGLKRLCDDLKEARRKLGDQAAKKLQLRINELINAPNLSQIPHTPPPRLHQLEGRAELTFAVDLHRSLRLVFTVGDKPVPYRDSGGVDKARVYSVIITFVGDYHE